MPKVKVGDINIYYEMHGEGDPLVLIPGLASSSSEFIRIIPALSQSYRVVAVDNRGAGQSDKPDIPYTLDMMADDLAGLVDEIGIKAAHIFGVSMGGMIVQHFALGYPEKVISLILGCTTPGGPHSIGFEEAQNTVDPERHETLTVEESARALLSNLFTKKFIDNNPELVEEWVALYLKNPPDPVGRIRQFQAVFSHDTYESLPYIKAPTLVITGDEDKMIPPGNSTVLASKIPNSKFVILEGVGHGFCTEVLEDTTRTILDFLEQNKQHTSNV